MEIKNQELENQLADKNKELKKLSFEVSQYERDKEKIKQDVENEFYQMNVLDVMNKATEPKDIWYACSEGRKRPKCNLCDDDRKLTHTFKNGVVAKVSCKCSYSDYSYRPETCEIYSWEYHKTKGKESRWNNSRNFYVSENRENSNKDSDAYDHYARFRIVEIYDNAEDAIKNKSNENRYNGTRFGFTDKKECQKYCDFLNKEKTT